MSKKKRKKVRSFGIVVKKTEQNFCMNNFNKIVNMIFIYFVASNVCLEVALTRISCSQDPYTEKIPPFYVIVVFLGIF